MREIKFRAWDKEHEGYEFSHNEHNKKSQHHISNFFSYVEDRPESWVVEQYTGLKDKNGVEIYEGDIIENYQAEVNIVEFMPDLAGFYFSNYHSNALDLCFYNEDSEVIGNIHQNPELIEDTE